MAGHLFSVGWDSQLLIWPISEIVSIAASCTQSLLREKGGHVRRRAHSSSSYRHKQPQARRVELEPSQVFRLGPDRHVLFLPVHMRAVDVEDSKAGLLLMLAMDGRRKHLPQLSAALYSSRPGPD